MKTVFIYALKCPLTGAIRYVGKSVNPATRLAYHFSALTKERNHRACWIRSLRSAGLKPILEIIDEVPEEHWQQWEVAYIEYFRERGCDLVNSTAGGEGAHGLSDEARARFSAARLGKKFSSESRAKLSASRIGIKFTPEHCSNLSASLAKDKHRCFNKKQPDNKSGFVGVCRDKSRGKWRAYINRASLGRFSKIEDAVFARALATAIYFSK